MSYQTHRRRRYAFNHKVALDGPVEATVTGRVNFPRKRLRNAMLIGRAAKFSGLSPKTIRYYEEIGLVVPDRLTNGYREYLDTDVRKLRLLQLARGLGYSIDECRALFSLYEDRTRVNTDVKAIVELRIANIDEKIVSMKSLRKALKQLTDNCDGDERPDNPVL